MCRGHKHLKIAKAQSLKQLHITTSAVNPSIKQRHRQRIYTTDQSPKSLQLEITLTLTLGVMSKLPCGVYPSEELLNAIVIFESLIMSHKETTGINNWETDAKEKKQTIIWDKTATFKAKCCSELEEKRGNHKERKQQPKPDLQYLSWMRGELLKPRWDSPESP